MWAGLIDLLNYLGLTKEAIMPPLVVGFFLYLSLNRSINKLKNRIDDIENCIIEMQGVLINKFKLNFTRGIANKYGSANSPIVLKKEYKGFITKPGLDKQIEEAKDKLLAWLKKKKPKTGLEAQDYVEILVVSQEIEKFLDLREYEQYLYQQGKTSEDAIGILMVYLFETLIPKLDFSAN